ncbi:MAG: hypothetical protein LBI64_07495, partial [Coriobacteriales bacterium]|nr:hypothetical protein [Coriobacteriales bacterium]
APSTPTPSTTTSTAPAIEVSAEGSAARVIDGTLGITDFSRSHKGTNKTYEDVYFGYRFPMAGSDAFAVIVIDEHTSLVYLPAAQAQTVRAKPDDTEAFIALLETLDEVVASGGTPLNSLAITYEFTSESSVERGA